MMLGACGVQMGTRFLVAEECVIHENYKARIIKASDIDTAVTGRSTGHPVRQLRNKMTREYLKKEQEGCSFEELEQMTLGSLRKAVQDGDADYGSMMSGQIAGLVKKRADLQGNARRTDGGDGAVSSHHLQYGKICRIQTEQEA